MDIFLPKNEWSASTLEGGLVRWQSPSNIALIKYWGKIGDQIPANPSISFTLDACRTDTTVSYAPADRSSVRFFFEGKENPDFGRKTFKFLEDRRAYFPWLDKLDIKIETSNTFPHSSGIASSASGMSALALCLTDIESKINPELSPEYIRQKASYLARLGSGSASRSVYGGLVVWGRHASIPGSDDHFAIEYPYETNEVFKDFRDVVLLVDEGKKAVSSTIGHGLLDENPYAGQRFAVARRNMSDIRPILSSGDIEAFGELVESEALQLHALMMTSNPYFILMKPNTLEIINRIWDARKAGLPVYFTLDAGANVHLLFPAKNEQKVMDWVKNEVVGFCQDGKYICDRVGSGPNKL